MKKLFLAGSAIIALAASSASAADLSAKPVYKAPPAARVVAPVYNWSGFYIGGNVGYARNHIDASGEGLPVVPSSGARTSQDFHASGFIGGGQLGFNYQFGPIVAGAEADIQGSGVAGSSTLTFVTPIRGGGFCGPSCLGTRTFNEKMHSFETVRGRLGLAWDRVLFYGTGGAMWANLDESANWVFPNPPPAATYPGSSSRTGHGGVWGGGVEYAFANNWTAKVEALGYRLGSDSFVANGTGSGTGTGALYILDTKGWLVRGGINYLFNWGKAPIVAKY